jgi:predicted metalloprotease
VIAVVGLVAIITAACGAADPGVTATRSRAGSTGNTPTDTTGGGGGQLIPSDTTGGTTGGGGTTPPKKTYTIIDGVVDFGNLGPRHPKYDGFLTAAFGDIQDYWAKAFPQAYKTAWTPLKGGIFAAYPDRTTPIPGCGSPQSSYQDVASRGAFYCSQGDFMAYDDDKLLPSLVDQLGKEAVAVVLAHEFGHAVQHRAGEDNQPVILKEQQADCFAGAWTAHVASGGSKLISFDDNAVKGGLIAMINVRDPVNGNGLNDPDAHGTGFDRVGAFQDGFLGGPDRCKTFFTEDRVSKLIDIPFDTADPNQGNLPLVDPNPDPTNGASDIVTLIPKSLDFFWEALATANKVPFTAPKFTQYPDAGPYPNCAGIAPATYKNNVVYCAADNTIYWDFDYALKLSKDALTGDMSVGYLFSNAYSDAIQTALKSSRKGAKRALFDDCLTGAWVGSVVPPIPTDRQDQLSLSAGDLDEAVITAIARGDQSTDSNVNGMAFDKITAFRTGVLGGLNVCQSQK